MSAEKTSPDDATSDSFTEAATVFSRAVDRLATILGMQAENDQRKVIGASMAYTSLDFFNVE